MHLKFRPMGHMTAMICRAFSEDGGVHGFSRLYVWVQRRGPGGQQLGQCMRAGDENTARGRADGIVINLLWDK